MTSDIMGKNPHFPFKVSERQMKSGVPLIVFDYGLHFLNAKPSRDWGHVLLWSMPGSP